MPKARSRTHATMSRGGQRVTVVLPKGQRKLTPALQTKVLSTKGASRAFSNPDKCRVIFFTASKPIVRCEGRKLRATNKRQCRDRKKQFIKCPGGRRRRRR